MLRCTNSRGCFISPCLNAWFVLWVFWSFKPFPFEATFVSLSTFLCKYLYLYFFYSQQLMCLVIFCRNLIRITSIIPKKFNNYINNFLNLLGLLFRSLGKCVNWRSPYMGWNSHHEHHLDGLHQLFRSLIFLLPKRIWFSFVSFRKREYLLWYV